MHAVRGYREAALAAVTPPLEGAARMVEYLSRLVGECYGILAKVDRAVDWLRNAFRLGLTNYPYLSRHSPFLVPIRDRASFQQFLGDVRVAWERFEA